MPAINNGESAGSVRTKMNNGIALAEAAQPAATLNEAIDDRVAALLVPAGFLSATYDDSGNLLTLTATARSPLLGWFL